MGNSREDKIQTGLRVPEKQYQRLVYATIMLAIK